MFVQTVGNFKASDYFNILYIFFLRYFENLNCWNELVEHLTQYRNEECRNILNVPDLDTSIEIRNALLEMRQNEPNLIRKLLSNKDEYIKLRAEFFPTAYNLRDL
mgnify:CR=1 FL=1